MGCDIHLWAERKGPYGWEQVDLPNDDFEHRTYGTFAFLAGVRNYSAVTPISEARGIPADTSSTIARAYRGWEEDAHNASWIAVEELSAFDYDAEMIDCRIARRVAPNVVSGAETCGPDEGNRTTYREFLGKSFFSGLEGVRKVGAERLVFWFDN